MARTNGGAVNETTETVLVFGVDPFGAGQANAIAAEAQRANAGRSGLVTIDPIDQFAGDAVVAVQQFLGAGQLERNLGTRTPNNNPVVGFHHTDSSPFYDDPLTAALADQMSRGVM